MRLRLGNCWAAVVAAAAIGFGSTADAAVSLSLVPDAPGPYEPGDSVNVDLFLVNEGEGVMQTRLLQLDVALTHPAIDVQSVELDFSSLLSEFGYGDFSSGTVYNWTYTCTCPQGFVLQYEEGRNRVGAVRLQLPDAPGAYVLDVLNALAPDNNSGANFQWDFADMQQAWSGDGTLTGGRMTLTVVPEPATLLLLALGGVAVARRRVASLPRSV